jgi:flagellar biosynthetic protein FliO
MMKDELRAKLILGLGLLAVILHSSFCVHHSDAAPAQSESRPLDLGVSATPGPSRSPTGYLLQACGSLLLVLALVYGAYWLLRRQSRLKPLLRSRGPIEVLDSRPLGPDRALHVIRVGTRHWLIGSTSGSMSNLAELTREDLGEATGDEPALGDRQAVCGE